MKIQLQKIIKGMIVNLVDALTRKFDTVGRNFNIKYKKAC